MHRRSFRLPLGILLLVGACDPAPVDPNRGPNGQLIPTTCEPSNTVSVEVGQVAEFRGARARYFCVDAGEEEPGEDFVAVVVSTGSSEIPFTARGGNTLAIPSPPAPPTAAEPQLGGIGEGGLPGTEFHAELRARELRELSPRVGPPSTTPEAVRVSPAPVPTVGGLVTLNAQANPNNLPDGACGIPLPVTGRVMEVSSRAIVVADTLNPSGGFTAADYSWFAASFDTLVAPLAEENFGTPTDIDGNGRVILLFTREVNRLTAPRATSFTTGFFFARDLFPRQPSGRFTAGCAHSNEAEVLYLMVPDPLGTINQNPRSRMDVDRLMAATIIHEYQHLINAARRLRINQVPGPNWSEETWLNEALSHAAEELLFYRESGLGPRMNLSQFGLLQGGPRAQSAFDRHQLLNFRRFFQFLGDAEPSSRSPFGPSDDLPTRGAAWSLLRYAADRWGEDQRSFLLALVNSSARGIENLSQIVGGTETLSDWVADWRVALYADGRVAGLDPRHTERSWNLPSIHAYMVGPGSYPLRTRSLGPADPVSRDLVAGGATYLRFRVAPGQRSQVEVTVNQALPPSTLRVVLLRTR